LANISATSGFVYHHEPAGRDAALFAGWLVCHFPTSEEAIVDVDLMGCGVDFPTSTMDAFTTGFAVAEPLPNPFVVKLLATGCDNAVVPGPSSVSAPTDPFVFRCPEKIIASFL